MRERELGVLGGQLRETLLLAARRRPYLDRRSAELREEAGETLGVGQVGGDDQLRRHARGGGVVLEAEAFEDGLAVLPFHVLEVERVAVDQAAVTEREELHRRTIAVDGEADHVDRADCAPVGALPLGEALDRVEPVAVPGRVLEPLLRRRLAHPRLERPHDRACVAGEEADHAVDLLAIRLLRDRPDAGSRAALDVEVEAGNARVAPRLRPFTWPELEDAVEHVERLAHLLRVGVRAEVDGAAAVALAREHHARVLVGHGDRDVRERLVVAQPHVERRPVALDEVLLQMQRLGLGRRDDDLDPRHPRHHAADALATVAAVEVAAHARPQGLRLAHVEDVVAPVAKEVHARVARKRSQLLANLFQHAASVSAAC